MIIHDEINQGTEEWQLMKWGKIGGTLSKGLFVKSDTLFIDILSQRLEEYEPGSDFTSASMDRGNDLEPFARKYIERYTKNEFLEVGWLQSEENELIGISPDGISKCETMATEIKCPGRKAHLKILLSNEVPLEYIFQCLHYFVVNPKLEKLFFISFRPEAPKHFIKELTLDSKINIGTKSRPKLFTIKEAVEIARSNAKDLLDKLIENDQIFNF